MPDTKSNITHFPDWENPPLSSLSSDYFMVDSNGGLILKDKTVSSSKIADTVDIKSLTINESLSINGSVTAPEVVSIPSLQENTWNDNVVTMKTLRNFARRYFFPIGFIFISTSATSPAVLYGDTWARWGEGRVPLGIGSSLANTVTTFGASAQGAINRTASEEMGGSISHALTTAQLASHNHPMPHDHRTFVSGGQSQNNGGIGVGLVGWERNSFRNVVKTSHIETGDVYWENWNPNTSDTRTANTSNSGSGTAHNNIQPYITCYMWKKTANS